MNLPRKIYLVTYPRYSMFDIGDDDAKDAPAYIPKFDQQISEPPKPPTPLPQRSPEVPLTIWHAPSTIGKFLNLLVREHWNVPCIGESREDIRDLEKAFFGICKYQRPEISPIYASKPFFLNPLRLASLNQPRLRGQPPHTFHQTIQTILELLRLQIEQATEREHALILPAEVASVFSGLLTDTNLTLSAHETTTFLLPHGCTLWTPLHY